MRIEDFKAPAGPSPVTVSSHEPLSHGWNSPAGIPWTLPLGHISASSMHMLEICPEQWRQRYILGKKEPPGQALVLGQLTHAGIEFGLDSKILSREEPELSLMIEWYHDSVWPKTLDSYGGEGEILWDDKPEEVRTKGAHMIGAYHPTIARLEPQEVEHEFRLDLGLPVPLTGFIDLIQRDGRPTVDWKTSARKMSEVKPQWRMQGRIYQLAVPRAVDFHVITKAKYPAVYTGLDEEALVEMYSDVKADQTRIRIAEALDEANYYYTTRGPDEPWPQRGIHHDWRCGTKGRDWCAWRSICPAWQS